MKLFVEYKHLDVKSICSFRDFYRVKINDKCNNLIIIL